jgi:hypothetical protein
VAAVSDEKTPRHQPVEGEHVLDQVASDAPIIVEDPDDCAVVVAAGHDPSASAVHVYDYFVVYSSTYQVPVLYFQASHLGTRASCVVCVCRASCSHVFARTDGRMLTWEEVWADVPSHHRDEDMRWNFITQQVPLDVHRASCWLCVLPVFRSFAICSTRPMTRHDTHTTWQEHPVTGVPCYHIHPCETKALMTSLTADASTPSPSSSNYLMAWLSAVGPVVGLHLPLTAWLSPASTNAPPYHN